MEAAMNDAITRKNPAAARGGDLHEAATGKRPQLTDTDRELLRRFVRGEITFAQLEGMTAEDAMALAEQGHGFFRSGRLKEARTIFEGLAAVNPLDPYPHQVLGAICEREEDAEAARKHYDVCLSLHADNPWVLARRGEIRVRAGDIKGGIEDLSRTCELDGDAKLLTTARAHLMLKALSDAIRQVGESGKGAPSAQA
jgi:predicted Zn-dependent protease